MRRSLALILAAALAIGACGRQAFLSQVGTSSGVPSGTPVPSPSGTPGPGETPALKLDTSASAVLTEGTSLRLTFAVTTTADRCLIAGLSLGATGLTGVTMTLDSGAAGQKAMTPVVTESNGLLHVIVEQLIAPASGPHTLLASWDAPSNAVLGAIAFSGANQTLCVGSASIAANSSAQPTVAVASSAGHLSVGMALAARSITSGTQTPQWDQTSTGTVGATLVQRVSQAYANTDTGTLTLPNPPLQNDTLVFLGGNNNAAISGVTGANTTFASRESSSSAPNCVMFSGVVGAAPNSQTVTFTAATKGFVRATVLEFAGLNATISNQTSSGNGGSNSVNPGGGQSVANPTMFVLTEDVTDPVTISTPTQGPWGAGKLVDDTNASQATFFRVLTTGTTLTPTSALSSSKPWASAMFGIGITGVNTAFGAAASTAAGKAEVTHQWTTTAAGNWAAVAIDVRPAN